MNRREFIKKCGVVAGYSILPSGLWIPKSEAWNVSMHASPQPKAAGGGSEGIIGDQTINASYWTLTLNSYTYYTYNIQASQAGDIRYAHIRLAVALGATLYVGLHSATGTLLHCATGTPSVDLDGWYNIDAGSAYTIAAATNYQVTIMGSGGEHVYRGGSGTSLYESGQGNCSHDISPPGSSLGANNIAILWNNTAGDPS